MRLKKCNAVLSLLSILLLFVHVVYTTISYLTFYYNPFLKQLLSIPLMVAVCIHAVLGMCIVFLQGDGTRADLYPGQNRSTIVQRISAALIFPLLILHLQTYKLLSDTSSNNQWFVFALIIIADMLFIGDVILHAATSLTKALITLGWLKKQKTKKILDRFIYIFGAVLFVASAVFITRTMLTMFITR